MQLCGTPCWVGHSGGTLFGVTHVSVSNCGNLGVSLGRLGVPLPRPCSVISILSRCVDVLQLQEKLTEQKHTEGVQVKVRTSLKGESLRPMSLPPPFLPTPPFPVSFHLFPSPF